MRFLSFRLITIGTVFAAIAALTVTACTHTPKFRNSTGEIVNGSIAEERKVRLGNQEQYVLIRGRDRQAPLMVFLHGGPGTSAMAFNRVHNADLENSFVFVNWDQRGTGYSYTAADDVSTLTLDRITTDLDELITKLLAEFHKESVVLVGHSWGSLLGLEYVSRHPEKVSVYIGIGQMADTAESETLVYDWALEQAKGQNDERAISKLAAIGPPPYDSVDEMMMHRSVVNQFGGAWRRPLSDIGYARMAVKAPEFSWLGLRGILRGGDRSLPALFSTFTAWNAAKDYPILDVPVYFFLGRHDHVVSPKPAEDYITSLQAPEQGIVWFENSAHSPQWEEPQRFMEELRRVVRPHLE